MHQIGELDDSVAKITLEICGGIPPLLWKRLLWILGTLICQCGPNPICDTVESVCAISNRARPEEDYS